MKFGSMLSITLYAVLTFPAAPWLTPRTPQPEDALTKRAAQEFREHNYAAAERDYRAVTRRDPWNIYAHFFLGESLFRQEKYAAAVSPYERARELNEQSKVFSLDQNRVLGDQLAMAYGLSGQLEKARAFLEYAIRQDPEYALNYYNLACAFAEAGNEDGALQNLARAFEHRDQVVKGEHLPDPRSDPSFRKYLHDERFMKLMSQLGYK